MAVGNSLDDELKLIADSGGTASVTPGTEAMLSIGRPVAGRYRRAGVTTGLGQVVKSEGRLLHGDLTQATQAPRATAAVAGAD